MPEYEYRTQPFQHQRSVFDETADQRSFAIFWEQGTGKTKITIDTIASAYERGEIDAVLLVAPGGVEINWITDELPRHMPERVLERMSCHQYQTSKAATKWHQAALARLLHHHGLPLLAMSYEAFMTKAGKNFAWKFLKRRRVFYVLDESHNIKTPSAKRTISIVASGVYAKYRRILTGTPIAQGPFDIYKQMQFIDEDFWIRNGGFQTFQEFKTCFGVFDEQEIYVAGGERRRIEVLSHYKNLDLLYKLIAGNSSRVTKDGVLDLPPKLYTKRYFDLTSEQERMYTELRDEFMTELTPREGTQRICTYCSGSGVELIDMGGGSVGEEQCSMCAGYGYTTDLVEAPLAIVRLLRLQQITCGYVPSGDEGLLTPIGTRNPRLDLLEETVAPLGHKTIIWARFRNDIDLIIERLEKMGRRPVRYDGLGTDADRERSKIEFVHGDATDFVGNPAKGREGLTLTVAKTVIYYNNSFKLIDRLQSEDRPHRIGQDVSVNYVDFVAVLPRDQRPTCDLGTVDALRAKFDIATQITGDKMKEWI